MEENNIMNNRANNASLNPYAVGGGENNNNIANTNYNTGYADVDNLTSQSNQLLQNSLNAQNQAISQGVQTNINELQRQSDKTAQETTKQNKAFYQQYQKQINPYGGTQEALAAQGLAHSGIAETTKTNIYNTYQKSLTDSLNNLKNVQADYAAKMADVRANGDIAMAQNLSNAYLQQIQQIQNAYTMAQAQKEFEWQKSVSDRNYNYQLSRDAITDKRYEDELAYQKERDRIADEQWNKQFALSQSKSSGGSSRKSSSGGSGTNGLILTDNPYSADEDSIFEKIRKGVNYTGNLFGNALKR